MSPGCMSASQSDTQRCSCVATSSAKTPSSRSPSARRTVIRVVSALWKSPEMTARETIASGARTLRGDHVVEALFLDRFSALGGRC